MRTRSEEIGKKTLDRCLDARIAQRVSSKPRATECRQELVVLRSHPASIDPRRRGACDRRASRHWPRTLVGARTRGGVSRRAGAHGCISRNSLAHFGGLRWRVQTGRPAQSTPAVAGGVVYLGRGDGNLYVLDAPSGERALAIRGGPRGHVVAGGERRGCLRRSRRQVMRWATGGCSGWTTPATNFDTCGTRATSAKRRWGVSGWWDANWAVDTAAVTEGAPPGGARAGRGGRRGGPPDRLRADQRLRHGRWAVPNQAEIQAVAEYGPESPGGF